MRIKEKKMAVLNGESPNQKSAIKNQK